MHDEFRVAVDGGLPGMERSRTRLPALGPRGEGWVVVQLTLMAAVALAGFAGPAWSGWTRVVTTAAGVVLISAGVILFWRGLRDLSDNLTPFPRPLEKARLVETGAYRLVRHPLYGGLVLAGFGWSLLTASMLALAIAGLLGVFADLKARREEVWLTAKFDAYAAYRRGTRRLIPWLY